ncbi:MULTISPECIES: hypothetical protein [unclassified Mesorhizobium]|uniref:hypothetical protein n=1 Tax=unclassified Mesorhizobium TaxID=325217 RepID=UPI00333B8CEE
MSSSSSAANPATVTAVGKRALANVEDGNLVFAGGIGTGFNARTGPEVKRRLDAIPMDKPPIPSLKANGAAWAECPAQSVPPQSIVEFEGGVIGVETAPAMAISTPSALFSISSRNERVNT